jgi:hypothetical protein
MPDVVKLVVSFLRAQPEVTALLPDPNNIKGQLPTSPSFPIVRVNRVASTSVLSHPNELDQVTVQLDVWGGNDRAAERIAATAKAALAERVIGYEAGEGHVANISNISVSGLPDETFDPPRRRYIVSFDLFTRPITVT